MECTLQALFLFILANHLDGILDNVWSKNRSRKFLLFVVSRARALGGRATGRIGHKQVHNVSVDALPKHKKKKFKKKKPVIVG